MTIGDDKYEQAERHIQEARQHLQFARDEFSGITDLDRFRASLTPERKDHLRSILAALRESADALGGWIS